jgi:hypothetical protein
LAAIENNRKLLDANLASWNQIKSAALPQLNSVLKRNNLPAVE